MTREVTIHLERAFFGRKERVFAKCAGLSAIAFRYDSGVCGLRLENGVGYITMLPFQGQQIWDAAFGGRVLTMRSMFREPRPTQLYLETYGGFLIHCGATAMGCPGEKDTHPLHGELPNAPYQKARLVIGEDEQGPFIGLSGEYQHTVAFNHNYVATPEVRLYAGSTRIRISITIENLKRTKMELMYLAHVNFRPVDNGRLVYSAPCTPEHVRVRASVPAHIHPPAGYVGFLRELEEHPERHNVLVPGLAFDPEVVFFIDYLADEEGCAHSLQVHPDGSADFISHRPDQLDHSIRWICRSPDQDALGLCSPATAEPEGYYAEKAKGNIRILPAEGSVCFDMEAGYLTPEEAQDMETRIGRLLVA